LMGNGKPRSAAQGRKQTKAKSYSHAHHRRILAARQARTAVSGVVRESSLSDPPVPPCPSWSNSKRPLIVEAVALSISLPSAFLPTLHLLAACGGAARFCCFKHGHLGLLSRPVLTSHRTSTSAPYGTRMHISLGRTLYCLGRQLIAAVAVVPT
jgi:hypothetical protein